MISGILRRFTRRHPAAGSLVQAIIILGATGAMLFVAFRDMRLGRGPLRPALLLAAMIGILIWLARTGLRRRV
jgi:hypothetical protein